MQARKMVNEASIAPVVGNLRNFPGFEVIGKDTQPEQVPFSWAQRRLLDLGVLVMPDTSPQPNGVFINWTTITGIIALCIFIGTLFAFTWNVAYNQGAKDRDMQLLQTEIDGLRKEAKSATTKADYAAGLRDKEGHGDANSNTEKRSK